MSSMKTDNGRAKLLAEGVRHDITGDRPSRVENRTWRPIHVGTGPSSDR